MKYTILTLASAGMIASSVSAATLASASFDTDSYIEFGTDNQFNPQITLGASQRPFSGHFNFGVIEFDVTSLTAVGSKYLSLSAVEFVTLTPNPMGPPTTTTSTTGNAIVQVVALGVDYNDGVNGSGSDYVDAASKAGWYDTHVQSGSVSVIGTINFNNASTRTIDVTSIVNGWIADGNTNHGFAIFSTSGNVEIASSTYTDDTSLRVALVDTPVTAPEPSSAALLGLGALTLLLRRKK